MKVFYQKRAISDYLEQLRSQGNKIGLVPTMGALHAGHLALLDFIAPHCDITVCSIFVNPTQFNNKEDLLHYPRTLKQDLAVLESRGCQVAFVPEVEEMYSQGESWSIELGELDRVFEGAFRPGHYQGVTQIVHKLFTLIRPQVACFGQKDYQQFLVIAKMTEQCGLDIELLLCPTVREPGGLAMSSRNVRLSEKGKVQAQALFGTLSTLAQKAAEIGVQPALREAKERLQAEDGMELEYLEIAEAGNLAAVEEVTAGKQYIALIALWLEGVRLIDNILFRG